MGQIKRMYEEMELMTIPDDLDYQYEQWLAEKSAYEEMLADSQGFNNFAQNN